MTSDLILVLTAIGLQLVAAQRFVNELPVKPSSTDPETYRPMDSALYPGKFGRLLATQDWLGVISWGCYAAVLLRQVPGFDTPLNLTETYGAYTQALLEIPREWITHIPDWLPLVFAAIALVRARAGVAAEFARQREIHLHSKRLLLGRGAAPLDPRLAEPRQRRR